ncbi:19378_t:CDS:2 [Gigaspora rosea]|nr:19378_t:CDS:2 [Gigaspora rosea]
MTKHLIEGNRETPIEGTPVDFKNLYCAAWGDNPDSQDNLILQIHNAKTLPGCK